MYAIASIEIIGLTPEAVGKAEPSQIKRSRTSHVSPWGLQAEPAGEPPMRAEPMMWNEPNVQCPAPQPQASAARMNCSRRSEEHTSELQSRLHLVCRLLLEKKKNNEQQPLQPRLPP